MYFSIKQCLNYFIQPHQCIIMPITIGFFFHGTDESFFLYFLWEKFVWYKSKDLERIKDVYRGTTVV
jgi:hypothetical protein